LDGELEQLIRYGPPDAAASVSWGDKHAGHFAFSTIKALDRTRTDDFRNGHCTQQDRPITIEALCVIDIGQTRVDEISYERIRVKSKVLVPNVLNQPSSLRRVAALEPTNREMPWGC
jgi:hypothetical protein